MKDLSVMRTVIFTAIFFMLCGLFLWTGVIGFTDSFLSFFGCILFMVSTSALVFASYYATTQRMLSALIISVCIMAVIFCVFAMVEAIPGLPHHPVYGMIAVPFLIFGGGVTTVDIVHIKVRNKKGEVEERTYEITKRDRWFKETVEKIKRIK